MSELRREPVVERWFVVMKDHRPRPLDKCPFCPGNEPETPLEVFASRPGSTKPNTPGWTVRVIPNKYPLHTSPLQEQYRPRYHWHFEVRPILTRVVGFEWGTGFFINPVLPEDAARFMREVYL